MNFLKALNKSFITCKAALLRKTKIWFSYSVLLIEMIAKNTNICPRIGQSGNMGFI